MQPQRSNEDASRARMFVMERKRPEQRFNLDMYLRQQFEDRMELEHEIAAIAIRMNFPLSAEVIQERKECRQSLERESSSSLQTTEEISSGGNIISDEKSPKWSKRTLSLSKSESALDKLIDTNLKYKPNNVMSLRCSKTFITLEAAAAAADSTNFDLTLPELQIAQLLKKKSSTVVGAAIEMPSRRHKDYQFLWRLKRIHRIILLLLLILGICIIFMKKPSMLISEVYNIVYGQSLPQPPRRKYFLPINVIMGRNN